MSRIDEALRRAAGQSGTATAATGEGLPLPLSGTDASELASEPFPIEIGEHRRPRQVSRDEPSALAPLTTAARVEPPPAEPAPAPVPTPASVTETVRSTDGPSRVFERLDARLAEKVVADENISPVSREQYRRLAAVLHDAQATSGLRVIMIASAVPGEGKTLTASNLALTLSESYRDRVLLIDADLRRPALAELFRLKAAAGLIEGLQSDAKLVLRQVSDTLSVLPAGRPTSDPMAALTSPRMKQLVDEAKESFDWVILDTPPLMLLPDAHLLSGLVDGAVLVVRAGATPFELVKRASEIIGRDRITGVVLNHAETHAPGYPGYYSHNYYTGQSPRTALEKR
jgi:capsular exopolysaccharide synthesis family protein